MLRSSKEIDEFEEETVITNVDNISTTKPGEYESSEGWVFFKWVAIIWSIFCFFGAIYGLINVAINYGELESEISKTGITIGSSLGMGLWLGIWSAIAGPSALIYYLSKEK